MRFDLNMLGVLEAVMLERHVTRAAKSLAMSQPAVSNALRRARALTKDELFVKSARGVRPTSRMLAMWPDLQQSLQTIRATLVPQEFRPETDASSVRIAITDSLSQEVVPAFALLLNRTAPHTRATFLPHTNTNSVNGILNGALDCAIGMFPTVPRDLHVKAVKTDHYVCVMRKGHALARKMSLEQFIEHPQVLVTPSGDELGVVDGWLSLHERKRNIAVVVNHFADALRIVSRSDLLTCVPRGYLLGFGKTIVDPQKLAEHALPFQVEQLLYKLIWHKRNTGHPAHDWIRTQLAQVCETVSNGAGGAGTDADADLEREIRR